MKKFAVYIVASGRNGTIYIGMTGNLPRRIWEHKNKVIPGFTARYGCDNLVWFEIFEIVLLSHKAAEGLGRESDSLSRFELGEVLR